MAFLAGVLTIAAPCVLPMLPIVLGASLAGGAQRARPLFIAGGFVAAFAGVTLVFRFFSTLAGLSPDALRGLAIGGLLLFGAAMVWRAPFDALVAPVASRLAGALQTPRGGALPGAPGGERGWAGAARAVALGAALGIVWSPCAGPVLGAILTLLATAPDPASAAGLLLCYAVGAGVPMFAVAYGGQATAQRLRRAGPWLARLQQVFGVLVIAVALAMWWQIDVLLNARLLRFLPSLSQGL